MSMKSTYIICQFNSHTIGDNGMLDAFNRQLINCEWLFKFLEPFLIGHFCASFGIASFKIFFENATKTVNLFDYCLFEHKDDFPKIKKLEKYSKAIEKNYFDFIKLIKGGDFITEESIIDKTLFELDLNINGLKLFFLGFFYKEKLFLWY